MRILAVGVALVLAPSLAGAQARFQTGNFSWTPIIVLRDAGLDTNVYDEPTSPKRDTTAIVGPQVDGVFDAARFKLAVAGGADFVYFQRYAEERSINTRASVRADVPLTRLRPFGGLSFVDTQDRQNSEIDLRAKRREFQVTGGAGAVVTSRTVLELSGQYGQSRYREGEIFRGVVLSERLNRDNTGGSARMLLEVSPLTRFIAHVEVSQDRFVHEPGRDTDNLRMQVGFEFAPDAIIRGRGSVGFHKMTPVGADALGFEGVTASVDLSYTLLGRTRFDARVTRGTEYSLQAQPYYLLTGYGGEVTHTLLGPVEVIARYYHEIMDYPDFPERRIVAHLDTTNRYGGGIGVRPGDRFRVSVNYEIGERLSELPGLTFDRRRVFTNITYGF